MTATLVTAFVPLPHGTLRPTSHFLRFGNELLGTGLPIIVYTTSELAPTLRLFSNATVRIASYEECWALQYVHRSIPLTNNPLKDTAEFMVLIHQKTEFLRLASQEFRCYDRFTWIDFGLFYIPRITKTAIFSFFEHTTDDPTDWVRAPGAWPFTPRTRIDDSAVQWYLLGGILSCPRHKCEAVQQEVKNQLDRGCVLPFEVSTWAKCAQLQDWHIYNADHDVSMLDNYSDPHSNLQRLP